MRHQMPPIQMVTVTVQDVAESTGIVRGIAAAVVLVVGRRRWMDVRWWRFRGGGD